MTNCNLNTERELLFLISQGNQAAFTIVFNAYYNKLATYVFRFTESLAVTEEIVQDVFLKIWTNRLTLAEVEKFEPYLHVLARNHTFNCLKKMSREFAGKLMYEQEITAVRPAEINSAETAEAKEQLWTMLDKAVLQLSPQQQKVYTLSRREGLKQEEIAENLNISLETVKKHMVLALRSIKMHLTGNGNLAAILLFFITKHK